MKNITTMKFFLLKTCADLHTETWTISWPAGRLMMKSFERLVNAILVGKSSDWQSGSSFGIFGEVTTDINLIGRAKERQKNKYPDGLAKWHNGNNNAGLIHVLRWNDSNFCFIFHPLLCSYTWVKWETSNHIIPKLCKRKHRTQQRFVHYLSGYDHSINLYKKSKFYVEVKENIWIYSCFDLHREICMAVNCFSYYCLVI